MLLPAWVARRVTGELSERVTELPETEALPLTTDRVTGRPLLAVCGGLQWLGQVIADPLGLEGGRPGQAQATNRSGRTPSRLADHIDVIVSR